MLGKSSWIDTQLLDALELLKFIIKVLVQFEKLFLHFVQFMVNIIDQQNSQFVVWYRNSKALALLLI